MTLTYPSFTHSNALHDLPVVWTPVLNTCRRLLGSHPGNTTHPRPRPKPQPPGEGQLVTHILWEKHVDDCYIYLEKHDLVGFFFMGTGRDTNIPVPWMVWGG